MRLLTLALFALLAVYALRPRRVVEPEPDEMQQVQMVDILTPPSSLTRSEVDAIRAFVERQPADINWRH